MDQVQATPLIAIEFGDLNTDGTPRVRHLRITFATLMTLERNGARSALEQGTWESLEMPDLCEFFAAALRHEDPSVTPKALGKLIGAHNLEYLFRTLASAWSHAQKGDDNYAPLVVTPAPAALAIVQPV